ncbi:MAG: hypothetical protein B5766_02190 [Candidatus Lumbricidophila eiseniae]|uniref:UDP-N-acetylglucosamine kinase n=1 Tax=Candidatus Lumbricidiphila eiseniae TaxID=1969409 RepID=A0A2A6FTK1_9MICO|nr:MAG: hypothetical protein B5766_02190 [Candidatus Lumbricidophila eiseniae]
MRLALDHAIQYGYPVLLEGTFRDPAMISATATRFAEAGYRVEVVTVVTPAPVSRLAAEERFLRARPDPRPHHRRGRGAGAVERGDVEARRAGRA